ncbi:hypothetical protein EDD64_14913 [Effusibacillus lacus]|nr:hypothetical protein EDD64_14913 [Effusibacillus lacus]
MINATVICQHANILNDRVGRCVGYRCDPAPNQIDGCQIHPVDIFQRYLIPAAGVIRSVNLIPGILYLFQHIPIITRTGQHSEILHDRLNGPIRHHSRSCSGKSDCGMIGTAFRQCYLIGAAGYGNAIDRVLGVFRRLHKLCKLPRAVNSPKVLQNRLCSRIGHDTGSCCRQSYGRMVFTIFR